MNATYQAWDTMPDHHADEDRIGYKQGGRIVKKNLYVNQAAYARQGRTLMISFAPTTTTLIDLQLYDDNPGGIEVAGTVTAQCHFSTLTH